MTKRLRWMLPFTVVLMLALSSVGQASAAERSSSKASRTTTFTAQAKPIRAGTHHVRATGPCWRWSGSWGWNNAVGKLMYGFAETVEWCANAAKTKVTSIASNICSSTGGYFDYQGCNKSRGALGLTSLHVVDTWHFRFGCCKAYITADPSVDSYFYPNGGVSGTVYYDNP